jgi:xylulokinase
MYLGLDIGTSSVKAVLIDARQRVVASETSDLEVSRPHSGWSEQDPESWWTACEAVLDKLAAKSKTALSGVKGIGLSGHMHGATLIDAADKPLRPCILWNDVRSAKEAAELDANPSFRAITGNIVFPGFTAPKLAWVARHEPEVFAKVAKVLLPKDYVRLKLTGDYASDMSDSAGTSWLDVAKRDWQRAAGSDQAHPCPHAEALRRLSGDRHARPELARRWGMAATVVVAGARRQRRFGLRVGVVARHRLRLARHLRRALRLQCPLLTRPRHRRSRLLPCRARYVAPDGRDPFSRRRARMAGRRLLDHCR